VSALPVAAEMQGRGRVRRSQIRDFVGGNGFVSVAEISRMFGVSLVTARRDIRALDGAGLLHSYRGGAGPASRESTSMGAAQLVNEAGSFVSPGMTVGLAASTHAVALARTLCQVGDVTIVTNSLAVAASYSAWDATGPRRCDLVTLPGNVDEHGALEGPLCINALGSLLFDVVFLGIGGFDWRSSSFSCRIDEAEVVKAFRLASMRGVFVVPHSAWTVRSQVLAGQLTPADIVLCEKEPDERDKFAIASVCALLAVVRSDA
jgi:DeoR/GlpR family transcriptional regulator of sugar metabolism